MIIHRIIIATLCLLILVKESYAAVCDEDRPIVIGKAFYQCLTNDISEECTNDEAVQTAEFFIKPGKTMCIRLTNGENSVNGIAIKVTSSLVRKTYDYTFKFFTAEHSAPSEATCQLCSSWSTGSVGGEEDPIKKNSISILAESDYKAVKCLPEPRRSFKGVLDYTNKNFGYCKINDYLDRDRHNPGCTFGKVRAYYTGYTLGWKFDGTFCTWSVLLARDKPIYSLFKRNNEVERRVQIDIEVSKEENVSNPTTEKVTLLMGRNGNTEGKTADNNLQFSIGGSLRDDIYYLNEYLLMDTSNKWIHPFDDSDITLVPAREFSEDNVKIGDIQWTKDIRNSWSKSDTDLMDLIEIPAAFLYMDATYQTYDGSGSHEGARSLSGNIEEAMNYKSRKSAVKKFISSSKKVYESGTLITGPYQWKPSSTDWYKDLKMITESSDDSAQSITMVMKQGFKLTKKVTRTCATFEYVQPDQSILGCYGCSVGITVQFKVKTLQNQGSVSFDSVDTDVFKLYTTPQNVLVKGTGETVSIRGKVYTNVTDGTAATVSFRIKVSSDCASGQEFTIKGKVNYVVDTEIPTPGIPNGCEPLCDPSNEKKVTNISTYIYISLAALVGLLIFAWAFTRIRNRRRRRRD